MGNVLRYKFLEAMGGDMRNVTHDACEAVAQDWDWQRLAEEMLPDSAIKEFNKKYKILRDDAKISIASMIRNDQEPSDSEKDAALKWVENDYEDQAQAMYLAKCKLKYQKKRYMTAKIPETLLEIDLIKHKLDVTLRDLTTLRKQARDELYIKRARALAVPAAYLFVDLLRASRAKWFPDGDGVKISEKQTDEELQDMIQQEKKFLENLESNRKKEQVS